MSNSNEAPRADSAVGIAYRDREPRCTSSDGTEAVAAPQTAIAAGREPRCMSSDGTEADARIARLEAELAEQARERAELVNQVGHELRTPITVLRGFLRLLSSESHGELNADQGRFVLECLKSCERLDRFVSDLLVARSDASTPFPVSPAPADLHRLIEDQIGALEPLLDEHGLRLELVLGAEASPMLLDERRITQVLLNLMTNAIRHTPRGGLIRVATRDRLEGTSARVEVSVEDDGEGIDELDRERIFEPYVRASAKGASSVGLGIGLALCRRIVEAHGGSIRVESSTLGGAGFVFEWPRTPVAEEKDVDEIG